jgi:hypothetical protein
MRPEQKRLDELLARLVDETIDSAEMTELESLLEGNPEAQDRYLHYLGLHEDLHTRSGQSDSVAQQGVLERCSTKLAFRPNRVGWKTVAGLAASVALAGVMFFFLRSDSNFATIVDYGGPVSWTGQGQDSEATMTVGLEIGDGILETAGGDSWVELKFADGTDAQLSGIGTLEIEKRDNVVATPSAEAEVLGTQFNILASAFSTNLEVNEGLVRVKRLADGRVEEVKPDHEIVVALETNTDFSAHKRVDSVSQWQSQLPRDIMQGQVTKAGNARALTHLWRGDRAIGEKLKKPVLLHSIVLDPSASGLPRVKIQSGQSIVVKGRTLEAGRVHIGFATNHWEGGLAGKFASYHPVLGSEFEIELSLVEMPRTKPRFATLPNGQEMIYLWVQSVHKDIGLEVESVQLLP